jgi:DivIVA domain-containing protein
VQTPSSTHRYFRISRKSSSRELLEYSFGVNLARPLSGPSGSIDSVTLVLLYLVVLILVAVVLFALGSVLFGRGEPLPPLPHATTATVLPASGVTGADVDAVKFTQTVRGYKTSEVDWVLDRLGQELDLLRGQLATVRAAHGLDDDTEEADEPAQGGAHALVTDDKDEA